MAIKVITPPTQVIDTDTAKAHLRVSQADEDTLIDAYILAAHAFAEHYTGRAIGSQTLELALDEFPDGAIELPRGKVTGITSLKYIDENGDEQTVSTSDYTLDDYSQPCWLVPAVDVEWPDTDDVANAVKVRYVAGDVPDAVTAALLLLVAHLHENKGETSQAYPQAAFALLDTVKVYGW